MPTGSAETTYPPRARPSEGGSAQVLPRILTKVHQQELAQQGLVKGKNHVTLRDHVILRQILHSPALWPQTQRGCLAPTGTLLILCYLSILIAAYAADSTSGVFSWEH